MWDIICIIILVSTIFLGIYRGLFKEIYGFIILIIAIKLAIHFAPLIGPLWKSLVGDNKLLLNLLGFVSIYIFISIAGLLLGKIIEQFVKLPGINILNRCFGGAVGGVKGILIVWLLSLSLILVEPISPKLASLGNSSKIMPLTLYATRNIITVTEGVISNYNKSSKKLDKSLKQFLLLIDHKLEKYQN